MYSRKKIRTLNGIGGAEPTSLLLSQDCKRLVTQCGGNGTAHVFDESGDKAVASFALGGHGLASCILAPDGKFLAWITQEDNQDKGPKVHVWNIDEKKERWKFAVPTPPLNSHMSFSPDGRYLALSGNPLMIWDLEKGQGPSHARKGREKDRRFSLRIFSGQQNNGLRSDTLGRGDGKAAMRAGRAQGTLFVLLLRVLSRWQVPGGDWTG